jgi:hypothetical protein
MTAIGGFGARDSRFQSGSLNRVQVGTITNGAAMRGEARVNDRRLLKASLGFCLQVRRGAIRRSTLAPTPLARVALFAGAGLAYGIAHECVDRETTPQTLANFGAGTLAGFRRWEYGFTK